MIISSSNGLGFSLNPLHYAKKAVTTTAHVATSAVKTTAHVAVAAGKGTVHVAEKGASLAIHNPVAQLALFPPLALAKYVAEPALKFALKPVTNKINTMKDRRAKKLAWDSRKSTTPTPAERNQARSWAKGYLRGQAPPLGLMLSLLAGSSPAPAMNFGESVNLGDPGTATIIASIPALLALMNSLLGKTARSGDAPEKVGGGGTATLPPGAHDLTPVQNAVDEAAAGAAGGDDASAGGGGGSGGSHSGLPGGITKKQLMIGGAVLGGIVLITLLRK